MQLGQCETDNHLGTNEASHLTRPRSATAGESEHGLQWKGIHKEKRGSTPASGWLHRLVRCLGATHHRLNFASLDIAGGRP